MSFLLCPCKLCKKAGAKVSLFEKLFCTFVVHPFIKQVFGIMKKELQLSYTRFSSLKEIPADDLEVVKAAQDATRKAHAPYSHFHVGAAARLKSGEILSAGNFESEVYPAGLCAERSLLFFLESNHADDPIVAFAIASNPDERECYPCGQCRQVLVDVQRRQKTPFRIYMTGRDSATMVDSAEILLPFTFIL